MPVTSSGLQLASTPRCLEGTIEAQFMSNPADEVKDRQMKAAMDVAKGISSLATAMKVHGVARSTRNTVARHASTFTVSGVQKLKPSQQPIGDDGLRILLGGADIPSSLGACSTRREAIKLGTIAMDQGWTANAVTAALKDCKNKEAHVDRRVLTENAGNPGATPTKKKAGKTSSLPNWFSDVMFQYVSLERKMFRVEVSKPTLISHANAMLEGTGHLDDFKGGLLGNNW